ncbi:MAG: type II secretion system secretin GspD [Deltaproteobacteria bacterium]|nr:type II secretion system secretin GspD [Deltaproteobacteria bacterium]
MILKYSIFIKTCFLMMFVLGASPACQTQEPLLNRTPAGSGAAATPGPSAGTPSSVRGRTIFSAEEPGEPHTERMEVISTPFGLVKVRARGPEPSQGKSASEGKSVSREPPAVPKSESLPTKPAHKKKDAPDEKSGFIAHQVAMEDPPAPDGTSGGIVLNFDKADLMEVIRAVAEILKFNYIVDPSVRGNVTIHTAGALETADIWDVFLQILEINGVTAVKSGNLYRIAPTKEAPRMPIFTRMGRQDTESLRLEERVIMQIIPLNHISAAEMAKTLSPFISSEGVMVTQDQSNIIILVDKGVNILKALRLVETFDIDLFENYTHAWYPVQHMDAEELVKVLKDVLKAYGRDEKEGFQLMAIKRLNRLLAISPDKAFFTELEKLIKEFDQPDEGVEPRIYVYFMKNGQADDFSGILMSIFSGSSKTVRQDAPAKKAEETISTRPPSIFGSQAKEQRESSGPGIPGGTAEGSGTLRGPLKITADPIRNALIIEAIPSDYRIVENILDQLDVLPRQVLIEVVIAEVSMDAKDEMGVAWDYTDGDDTVDLNVVSGSIKSDSGLNLTLGRTAPLSATLSALASDDRANILSAPLVLASDNKEAKIDISTQIPVASASIVTTGDNPLTQTTIQYRDTGIILAVTPHINDRGLVSMDISQEVSETGEGQSVGGNTYPSFRQRRVNTSLTVGDGQTIVMGGLMREKEQEIDSGVPFFSSIPILGFLFGKETRSREKTDLMLFITPRVIVNLSDVDAITQEFKQKVNQLMRLKERNGNP